MNNSAPLSPAKAGTGGARFFVSAPALCLAALIFCAFGCSGLTHGHRADEKEEAMSSVVFFGDSITFMGDWEGYFKDREVYNLGVSGDRVEHLIDRVNEVYKREPGKLFIMVGVNDLLSGFTIEETLEEFGRLLDLLPDCRIYVQSVLPVDAEFGDRAELIPRYNERLKALCEERGLEYLDIFSLYADEYGCLDRQYTRDGLHLRPNAYEKWVERIRELVEG